MASARSSSNYPRSRGKTSRWSSCGCSGRGPPLLAREDQRAEGGAHGLERTTPARAGRPQTAGSAHPAAADHAPPLAREDPRPHALKPLRDRTTPRSRGKTGQRIVGALATLGPPPLAREDLGRVAQDEAGGLTTCARAGRPRWRACCSATAPDHPRSRGKTNTGHVDRVIRIGPPPLAREDVARVDNGPLPGRTTPARAGRPNRTALQTGHVADHPRSRGKTLGSGQQRPRDTGPPPLAREDHDPGRTDRDRDRTTPARAGRPGLLRSSPRSRTDHPRSRGKNQRA